MLSSRPPQRLLGLPWPGAVGAPARDGGRYLPAEGPRVASTPPTAGAFSPMVTNLADQEESGQAAGTVSRGGKGC